MNTITVNLLTKLQEAISSGYFHHFFLNDGVLTSPFIPDTFYLSQVEKTVFSCVLMEANLYTIATLDGKFKGILIIEWMSIVQDEN